MMLGSSVNINGLEDVRYIELLDNFDYWYPDGGFGWGGTCKNARAIVDLAIARSKPLRGNCLLSCTTHGLSKEKFAEITPEDVYNHIDGVLDNFPEIVRWDCTHEALADNGRPRKSKWAEILGADWQQRIFRYAKEFASQDVTLFYCDYFRTEAKFAAAYQMISQWRKERVPIDGISIQLHSNLKPSFAGRYSTLNLELCERWIRRFKTLGLIIDCPEIVVWQPINSTFTTTQGKSDETKERVRNIAGLGMRSIGLNIDMMQARVYEKILAICERNHIAVAGFWSAFDKYPWNWIGNRCNAGLWDLDYRKKKSFYTVFKNRKCLDY